MKYIGTTVQPDGEEEEEEEEEREEHTIVHTQYIAFYQIFDRG